MAKRSKEKDKQDRERIKSDIEKFSCHIINVIEDDDNPEFTYTVGFYEKFKKPEIIIIGLKQELAHTLLNNIAFDLENGKSYEAGKFYEGVLDDFLCYFGEVPKSEYKEYVGYALWYYEGDNFPLLQLIYPTVKGIFPWQKSLPEDAKFFMRTLIELPKE